MVSRIVQLVFPFLALVVAATDLQAQSRTVFNGVPVIKISEGGLERLPEVLLTEKATNLRCVISEIGGKYYWATRENKELTRRSTGAFITYSAVDGSGYIRVIDPAYKAAVALASPTESRFDYVEHLLLGLRSVTYYGKAQ
jgi:hypothetical protein